MVVVVVATVSPVLAPFLVGSRRRRQNIRMMVVVVVVVVIAVAGQLGADGRGEGSGGGGEALLRSLLRRIWILLSLCLSLLWLLVTSTFDLGQQLSVGKDVLAVAVTFIL